MLKDPMKPNECCDVGTHRHQIPMPIMGRLRGVEYCIADIVAALNAAGIETLASCCGHDEGDGIISLEDGRELTIAGWHRNRKTIK